MFEARNRLVWERDIAILCFIARNAQPVNKYKIWTTVQSKSVGTEPTILTAIDELEESGLIFADAVHTNMKARGGKPSKHYDLTLLGLCFLITGIKEGIEKIELSTSDIPRLLKKYENLAPQIFSKWDTYKTCKVVDLAERCIFGAADRGEADVAGWIEIKHMRLGKEGKDDQRCFLPIFVRDFFFKAERFELNDRQRWLKAMKDNRSLREPYIEYLEDEKRKNLAIIERIDKVIRTIES